MHEARTNEMLPVVVLSTADFDAPVWTNKQHLSVGLAEYTSVTYIESYGLRQPALNIVDGKRALQKLINTVQRKWKLGRSTPCAELPGSKITIVTPRVLPFHKYSTIRAINRIIVNKTIVPKLAGQGRFILWTFSPLTYGLEAVAYKTVYHSVDLLHEIPGVPKSALVASETRLLKRADRIIASSSGVANHLEAIGAKTLVKWENVASVELFARSGSLRKDRAIFAGNLTPTKVDFELLKQIAKSGVDIALAGPLSIDGVSSAKEFDELMAVENVYYLGNLSLDQLATEVANSTVGLIPYHLNSYTNGVFPMKVYEYLAAGLSVVSTPLPSLTDQDILGLQVVENTEFSAAVSQAHDAFNEIDAQTRRDSAAPYSWSNRIKTAAGLVHALSTTEPRHIDA